MIMFIERARNANTQVSNTSLGDEHDEVIEVYSGEEKNNNNNNNNINFIHSIF